jgi:hypothetical protein
MMAMSLRSKWAAGVGSTSSRRQSEDALFTSRRSTLIESIQITLTSYGKIGRRRYATKDGLKMAVITSADGA